MQYKEAKIKKQIGDGPSILFDNATLKQFITLVLWLPTLS